MKVTGPMLSLSASGTLGNVITANALHGGTVMRKKPDRNRFPSNAQRANYAFVGYLKHQWRGLDVYGVGGNQAAWASDPGRGELSPYHYFLSYNIRRWKTNLLPVIQPGYSDPIVIGGSYLEATGYHGYFSARWSVSAGGGVGMKRWFNALFWWDATRTYPAHDLLIYAKPQQNLTQPTPPIAIENVRPGVYQTISGVGAIDGTWLGTTTVKTVTVT